MAKKWIEDEMNFLKDNFLYMSNGELARHFGVTAKSIENKLRRMGLKRDDIPPRFKAETRKKLSTAEEERLRKEAIQMLDDSLKSICIGEKKEARWQLLKLIRKYPDMVDIVSVAKEYIQRLKAE